MQSKMTIYLKHLPWLTSLQTVFGKPLTMGLSILAVVRVSKNHCIFATETQRTWKTHLTNAHSLFKLK